MIGEELHIVVYDNINIENDLNHEILHYYVYLKNSDLSYEDQEKVVCKLTRDFVNKIKGNNNDKYRKHQ